MLEFEHKRRRYSQLKIIGNFRRISTDFQSLKDNGKVVSRVTCRPCPTHPASPVWHVSHYVSDHVLHHSLGMSRHVACHTILKSHCILNHTNLVSAVSPITCKSCPDMSPFTSFMCPPIACCVVSLKQLSPYPIVSAST